MDDLISRWSAIDALTDTNLKRNVDSLCDGDMNRTIRAAQRVIAQLPAVDAVQEVRCKDCICYDDEPGGTLKMCYCGLGWTSPDDYCSKGARAKKMDGESNG